MTSNNEVEIQAQSIEDGAEHKVICQNFSGHWNEKHKKFFYILEERVDFQKKNMKGWDTSCILKLITKYNTTSIGWAKFLHAIKEAAIQYVELEKNNTTNENDDNA